MHAGNEPLTFTADASFAGDKHRGMVSLKPFYDTHHTRYAIYWNLFAPDGVSSWSGGGQPTWSDGANRDVEPAAGMALRFSATAGGTPSNELTAGSSFNGVEFSNGAGTFAMDRSLATAVSPNAEPERSV